jgi:hypothetical protein
MSTIVNCMYPYSNKGHSFAYFAGIGWGLCLLGLSEFVGKGLICFFIFPDCVSGRSLCTGDVASVDINYISSCAR